MQFKDYDLLDLLNDKIQKAQPELLFSVSTKISDEFLWRIKSPRNLNKYRNPYAILMMYALCTKDLYLFPRLFKSEAILLNILGDLKSLAINSDLKINPTLLLQYKEFYIENQHLLTTNIFREMYALLSHEELEYIFKGAYLAVANEIFKE